ncbi:hydrocephalus-inducing protein homolog [Hippoglossus hippoglossus]|uniref:hydrocephalus-inducing protein homolog n=1 Tax=Hippoglossus hippoglossus TaxID=8267 RepID=UPI00148E11BA|nr:hydrocephalus-inducing protein homolog [Hippoglossus hippoglossus]
MAAIQMTTQTKLSKSRESLPYSHKLVLTEDKSRRVTPSVYSQEMLQSTEERLANTKEMHPPRILELLDMSKTTHHKLSLVDVDQALFQPCPSELCFQNFSPAQTYKLPLILFNMDKVSRQVKLELEISEYFHVGGSKDSVSKVAPGMSTTFTVCFTPQENKDYHHRLVFVTERERFEVPVRAIGPRAILDFRDELHLPLCPVKASTEKTQLVRNIGNRMAKFKLHTQRPFSVTPSSGTLDIGESMQVTVNFHPVTTGDHSQDLHLHYHTGEDVCISLYGACEEMNLNLNPDSIVLTNTYISMANVNNVSLTNTSDIPIRYRWSVWPSQEEEDLCLLRESSVLQQKEEEEKERLLLQCESDPTAIHPLLARAVQECRSQDAKEHLLALSHSCITVDPMEGEIWPNVTAQFNIVFKPEESKLYQQTIYCDVTGRESRLPLIIQAEGMGPKLHLNYNLLDMKNVFISSKNCFEVLVSNKGLIDAPFELSCPDTTLGRCFSFSPEEGVIPSGGCQIVEVTFHSRILGTFSEDLLLAVTGQPKPLTLTFRGCVVGPTFHFNVSELNFGDVAFGFPLTAVCTLFNTSLVPMTFALRVLGDGLGSPSVNGSQQVSEMSRTNWRSSAARDIHARPVEFTVNPAVGSVRALSDVTIKVTLCSNTAGSYRLALVVDVEGVGEEIMTLPINARCVVPEIVLETPVLDFQRCFLNYSYEQQVRLSNPSTLPVCYGLLDQEYEENPSQLFGSSRPRGVIFPHTSETVPVFLLTKAVGRLQHSLLIAVYGSAHPPLEVVLSSIGQGPVVHVQNPQLDFGKIPVLTDVTRTLHLSNQSPTPANFTARMSRGKSFWRVEPSEGEVPPNSQLELCVVAHLRDTIEFQDRMEVSIQHGQTLKVPLSATGTGTTIVSDRPFAPILDLGTHFSHEPCQYHFKLTNQGQRVHRMYWGTDGNPPQTKTRRWNNLSGRPVLPPISDPKKKDVQKRGSLLSCHRDKPVFSLMPSRVELFPGCSADMVLTGSSDSNKVVQERLLCKAIVGQQGSYELLMSVDVTCRFVAPVLGFSSKQLNFYIEKVPGNDLRPLYEKLVLKNVSSLNLSMKLSLVAPFSLCDAPGAHSSASTKSMVLGDGKQADLWVCFHPDCCQDRVSRVVEEFLEVQYEGHPQQDLVELHAEVHFPNLHFSSTTVDFGCVLNHSETQRRITITNCSKLPVSYRWAFLENQNHCTLREMPEEENVTEDGGTHPPPSLVPLNPRTGVDEVFDVLPVHGRLQPGDQQLVEWSFYGHTHISREVTALCHVEEGPAYEIKLRGEASVISYSLDFTHVNLGVQLFDHVGEAEVTLRNTGKVGFEFNITHPQKEEEQEEEQEEETAGPRKAPEEEEQQQDAKDNGENEELQKVRPGQPMVVPALGHVDAGAEQRLRVLYLPGAPEVFEKRLQLNVAFLPAQDITVTGEGVFPRISLDLPRNLSDECYSDVVQQARTTVEANGVSANGEGSTTGVSRTLSQYEELLHLEVERALVKGNAVAATASFLELRCSESSFRKCHKLSKFLLPEYLLDFGHVIPRKVLSHTVNVTNAGSVPVSFQANHKPLADTGFSAEFERVKNLPCAETQTFTVKFDPRGAKQQLGHIRVVMPIQVAGGPMVQVRLSAVVNVPGVTVSTDSLQFDTLQCGMCQIKTIQLVNPESVPCDWSVAEHVKPFPKVDKFLPLHVRKKVWQAQRPPLPVFEMIPSSGVLAPGKRVNVQIKFRPTERHAYHRQLVVRVAENTEPVFIAAQGQAEEPQLEFCPSVLELGPCLPATTDVESEVIVRNPCSFPIEFYSLDFDTQYLEEEKILRLMQGYEENNTLLLPPRVPGESLPRELLDYYKEHCSQLKEDEMTTEASGGKVGELEMNPVSRAIARHKCDDMSPEGLAARDCRGIAIIVYGAPQTGGSDTAAALAHHYGAACVSVDAVVTDVLTHGTSPVSLMARQVHDSAAAEYARKEAAQITDGTQEPGPGEHHEDSDPNQDSAPASLQLVPKANEEGCSGNGSKKPQETEKPYDSLCLGGDVTTLRSLLPDHLLVDILVERLQSKDCHRGVVIDDLNSVYCQSAASTLPVVLKALKNSKHIYVVNLFDSFDARTARDRAQREAEEALQKETAEREEQWLLELDEEEYDALPEEQKEFLRQQHKEKVQQQTLREFEQIAKEEEEKMQQEELHRLREEELKKKGKKGGKKDTKEGSRRKSVLEGKQSMDSSNKRSLPTSNNSKELNEGSQNKEADESQKQTEENKQLHADQTTDKTEREEPAETAEMKTLREEKDVTKSKKSGDRDIKEGSGRKGPPGGKESTAAQDASKESPYQGKEGDQSPKKTEEAKGLPGETLQPGDELEGEVSVVSELQSQFIAYEQSRVQVEHILKHWDQARGLLLVSLIREPVPVPEDPPADKQSPFGKRSKKAGSKTMSPLPTTAEADKEGDKLPHPVIIPHIVLNVTEKDHPSATELLRGSSLPPLDEVLDNMGVGPSGPPISPPVTFSVVPFPENREQTNGPLTCEHFTFLLPSMPDKHGEETRESEDDSIKEEAIVSKIRRKGSGKEIAVPKEKDKKSRESQRSKSRTTTKKKPPTRSPTLNTTTAEGSEPDHHQEILELKRSQSLTTFRWVVPANGEVLLKIWFYSESLGRFEQTFNFELLGSQRHYQLPCRGIGMFPSICTDYTTLFALSNKVPQMEEGVQKSYVVKPGYFEFGPLLCSKTRDRYKENRYPENTEKLVIHNNSGLEVEVEFQFQQDKHASTFLLDPPTMTLQPDQTQELTVWAYPTKVAQMNDSVICCIKDNPEPFIINFSCRGVRPELELESRHMHFDRVLLHRRISRNVTLRNKTCLPVSWRLQGVEELGDEFSVPQDQGIISANSSFPLSLHFRAKKPLHIKKTLRLEVSDVEKVVGILHTENILITAEAYDVALDISPDGCLDYGIVRAFEENKLPLKMKNQGKYEISYRFMFQQTEPNQPALDSIFTASPQCGSLMPHEKATAVQILLKPKSELQLRDQPILSCQLIEPTSGNGGETIAFLTIKVSFQSVFSRYKITPVCDINFGPLAYGCKKTLSFTIENNGIFDTRYSICRSGAVSSLTGRPGVPEKKDNVTGRPKVRNESSQKDMTSVQNRLTLGVFSVSPCVGILQPESHQVVSVDCAADQLGNWNQGLLIDVSDRDPSDQPEGIPYRLLAKVCKPDIALDMASIFEEHHLCPNSRQLSSEQFNEAKGIYVLDENKFIFNKVLVRGTVQARFKLTNSSKVPCVLSLSIKYGGGKSSRQVEAFDLPATTLNIPSQSHAFAVVTFTPQSMQLYSAAFEATVEGTSRTTPTFKTKVLEFDLVGEGNLPSVCVLRPALRTSEGSPVLEFRRELVGRRNTLPLVLLNDGTVAAQVQVDMLDKHGVFSFNAAPGNTCSSIHFTQLEGCTDSENHLVHRAALKLNVNEQVEIMVGFCSDEPLSVKAKLTLQVEDNQCSNTIIQVTGETYEQIVSLDNINWSSQEMDQDDERDSYEKLNFGDCHVDCLYQESFTMRNHSSSQAVRFEWPPTGPQVVFTPQVGHLHAGCSKEVTATFSSHQPVTLKSKLIRCKVCQVEFEQPVDQVADWDDRQRTGQWLSGSKEEAATQSEQPGKNQVTNTEPEPCCSVVEGSQWELDLLLSAVCDYVMFTCNDTSIHFEDTMLYQSRRHQLQLVNQGDVKLEYSWQVVMDLISNTGNDQEAAASAEARPHSAVSSETSLLKESPELPPFSVEPSIGFIGPGSTQNFSICFSPLEVDQFQGRLLCSIPNLQEEDQAPCIPVCGRSLQPHCHFDLEDSDYVTGNHRNPEFRDSLDPDIRILEFNAVGLSVPSTRSFALLNPTDKLYSYNWKCEDAGGSLFRCLTPCGIVQPGKHVEMLFEYVAVQLDVVESFWSFVIETLPLTLPFLFVGNAREPLVYLSRPLIDLGELLVGHKVEQTVDLVNGDEEPFHFSVQQSSLLCEDQQSNIIVQPMSGTVAPKDRLPLTVFLTPCREGYVSCRLTLKVKKRSELLTLTVKADCFTMSTLVQVVNPDGGLREIDSTHQVTLDFGEVDISKQPTIHLLVTNLARFSLDVSFDLTGPSELLKYLEAKPQNASVESGKQMQLSLLFFPRGNCYLQDVSLSIKVKHGPTFTFVVIGRAVAPSLDFSFTEFNFGKCFLYCPGMVLPSKTLVISNKGDLDISVQSQFKNTSNLEMDFQSIVLLPGAVMEVPVTFYPREARRYHEKLSFVLNGCVTKQVDIHGQGVEMKLHLEDPKHREVKLGSLMLGQKVKKQVVLVNRSRTELSFTLLLHSDTPLDPKDLSFSPAGKLSLKARGGSCKVEIQFSPRQHIPLFKAELQAELSGLLHPLLTIQGCCHGVEVRLDQDHLAFGPVAQRCQATKRIVMTNTGDIGVRFHWEQRSFPAELSISPAKGSISPGMKVPFDLTFAPKDLSKDTRYENLTCSVESRPAPVTLTVTGSCIAASTSKEVVNFVCPVRCSHPQTLTLVNPTNQRCTVRPVIEGKHWRAAPSVTLEALQSKTYEITYRPLTMTAEGKKHLGSVFFSFPDGTGVMYTLQGTAEPPKPEDTVAYELPAKTQHTQSLPVHNWLSEKQRFNVQIKILKPEKPDATMSLEGPKFINVPALTKADYKMTFSTYREGQYNYKVTFLNEGTGEYMFYLVSFKATCPEVLSTIKLVSIVRRTASATVQVENPLTTSTCLTTECKCADISAPPQQTVPGQSKGSLSFEYQPLRAGESTTRLTLFSTDLGLFPYDLLLRALPAPLEKPVHFNTSLGSSHFVLVKFINYSRFKTEYTCKTDCPDFTVDKSLGASPGFQAGCEASVEVCFEPHQLGEVKGQLTLTSAIGGEYIFPLLGICTHPKAQGPFSIRAGRNITIQFKNVFAQSIALSYQVDNPSFTVKGTDTIPSKKLQNIVVSFEAPAGGPPGPWSGKLTISSQRDQGHSTPCSWVYYLRGYRPDTA